MSSISKPIADPVVKELQSISDPSKSCSDTLILTHRNIGKIEWIKHFFNITEEDLQ